MSDWFWVDPSDGAVPLAHRVELAAYAEDGVSLGAVTLEGRVVLHDLDSGVTPETHQMVDADTGALLAEPWRGARRMTLSITLESDHFAFALPESETGGSDERP